MGRLPCRALEENDTLRKLTQAGFEIVSIDRLEFTRGGCAVNCFRARNRRGGIAAFFVEASS